MDWLSLYEDWVVVGDTIIIISSLVLLVICNFGFTVYHVAMRENENRNYFLLNEQDDETSAALVLRSIAYLTYGHITLTLALLAAAYSVKKYDSGI